MSTVLGGVTLTSDMVWDDEFGYTNVSASVTPTIGGGVQVQEFTKTAKGRELTLSSREGFGYQLKQVVTALHALADVAGATYNLAITDEASVVHSWTVRFRNELDGGAVQFSPVQARENIPRTTMYYEGTIYLMVV